MNHTPFNALLAVLAGAIGGLAAIGPIAELAFLAQSTGLGALLGATVALYRDRRYGPDGDRRAMIVTTWSLAGTFLGLIALLTGVA